jgi:hypothetical protein
MCWFEGDFVLSTHRMLCDKYSSSVVTKHKLRVTITIYFFRCNSFWKNYLCIILLLCFVCTILRIDHSLARKFFIKIMKFETQQCNISTLPLHFKNKKSHLFTISNIMCFSHFLHEDDTNIEWKRKQNLIKTDHIIAPNTLPSTLVSW